MIFCSIIKVQTMNEVLLTTNKGEKNEAISKNKSCIF